MNIARFCRDVYIDIYPFVDMMIHDTLTPFVFSSFDCARAEG